MEGGRDKAEEEMRQFSERTSKEEGGEGREGEGIFTRARLRGVFVKGPGGRGESINFWENETAGRKVGFFLYVCMGGRIFRMVEENGTRR